MDSLLELTAWRTWVVLAPLGLILATAATTDFRERRIPNWLTYPSVPLGLLAHGLAFGLGGLGWALLMALITLVVGFVMAAVGWMGGGDAKLLTGVAAFLGAAGLAEVLFYAVICGSLLGFSMALVNGYLWEMLKKMGTWLVGIARRISSGVDEVGAPMEVDERSEVPFGVAIFFGALLAYTDAAYRWPGVMDWFLQV